MVAPEKSIRPGADKKRRRWKRIFVIDGCRAFGNLKPHSASPRAKSLGILGRGNEAIVVELAPTETLLKDKAFRDGLAETFEAEARNELPRRGLSDTNTAPAKEAVDKVLAWAVKEKLIRK